MNETTNGKTMLTDDCAAYWDYRANTVEVYVEISGILGARIGTGTIDGLRIVDRKGKRVTARDWSRIENDIYARIRENAANGWSEYA